MQAHETQHAASFQERHPLGSLQPGGDIYKRTCATELARQLYAECGDLRVQQGLGATDTPRPSIGIDPAFSRPSKMYNPGVCDFSWQ
jgi:hypothetical protein